MAVKLRSQIDDKYKWNLSSIIESEDDYSILSKEVATKMKSLADFAGKLSDKDELIKCFKLDDELSIIITNLCVYAKMKHDEDAKLSKYQELCELSDKLSVQYSSICSYINPELSSQGDDYLKSLLTDSRYADYDYYISNIIRQRKHILSEKEEKLLAEVGSFSDGFHDIFNMYDNVDLDAGSITTSDGSEETLSHATYGLYMQDPVESVRKSAFMGMHNAYKKNINTIGQTYIGSVKKDSFFSKIRGYKSSIERALNSENVTEQVYRNLILQVEKSLPLLNDYLDFRAAKLGKKTLESWDLGVGLFEGKSISVDYPKAYSMVTAALKPLGEDYIKLLDTAYNESWIDVYENKNKRGGAYSWGTYTSHPYVLLNYEKTTHDVFTIAHELGHALHSHYSNTTQPYNKAGYEIFVAEIASTVNEVLLLKHIMNGAKGDERRYYASYYLDMFRTTVFRQTQFAEFEVKAHDIVDADMPLTTTKLNEIYSELLAKYYSHVDNSNDVAEYEWARIPHFYRNFYVYKYSTGLVSAVSIVNSILTEGAPAVERYRKFLSLGGSMPPLDILKVAGVDLSTDSPYDVMRREMADCLKILND